MRREGESDIQATPVGEIVTLTRFPGGELHDGAELGAVTEQTVRVWARQPGAPALTARLEIPGFPPIIGSVPLSAETDWTGALTLSAPAPVPDQPFVCTVGERRLSGRFAPAPDEHCAFAFAFGSCHRPYELDPDGHVRLSERAKLYPAMREELLAQGARFLLLCGDQVYSDALPPISVRENLPGDEDHPPPLETIIDAYRRVTRGYLGETGFRALREAFPTYCIWDDHDIFTTWGSRLHETPLDRRLFQAASRVYCEYQHSRNPGASLKEPPYHYTFRFGTAGFLVLDVRGARHYPSGTLLGTQQWEDVQRFLGSAEAASLHTLFVITSIPVAHVSRWLVRLFQRLPGHLADEVRDRWCSDAFVESRNRLLSALFDWQTAAPYRQVALLSGDVHAASAFTIRRRGKFGAILECTSSPLTTKATRLERWLNLIATRAPNLLEPELHFERHFLVLANNYGLVRLRPLPGGGHHIEFTVRAWEERSRAFRTAGRLASVPHS